MSDSIANSEWPFEVDHDGLTFEKTGKEGTNRKTGLESHEYGNTDNNLDRRVWLVKNGVVIED